MQQLLCPALLLAATVPFSLAEQCTYTSDSSAGLSEDKQTASLKVVNDRREKLAKGEQLNGWSGETLPAAKQIDPLTWSCTLEEAARDTVSTCPFREPTAPSGYTGFFYLYFNYGSGEPAYYVDGMLNTWTKIIDFFEINYADGEEVVKFDGTKDLMAYANLMREDISEIGCVEKVCDPGSGDDRTLVYCLINKEWILGGSALVRNGPGGTVIDTSGPNFEVLMLEINVRGEGMPINVSLKLAQSRQSAPAPQSPAEFPPAYAGPNERCPENSGMHDTLRSKFLDMHNYRRAELAKGNIAKRNGNYLPQSSDMQRMRYNCALEKEVINYVSTCPSSKSAEFVRPNVGENFIRLPQEGLATYLAAVQKAVTPWWKVIRTEEGPGLQVYFRQKHVGTLIESFTQMGWSTSRKLGCAIAKCGSDYVAVCRYSPRGNCVEQVIYKKGTPCTACASGSWCTEDALCTLD